MRSLFIGVVFFSLLLSAQTITTNYKVEFGVFGTIGTIQNTIKIDSNRYQITTKVKAARYIQKIFGNYSATYTSKGVYRNGKFESRFFVMESFEKGKRRVKRYTIDPLKHMTYKEEEVWKGKKLLTKTKSAAAFYGSDDLLTLYFNAGYFFKTKKDSFIVRAVGLEKQNGRIPMRKLPTAQVDKLYKSKNAVGYMEADIVSKNIKKKRKNLVLAIGKDGRITKAVIKNILFYGDARVLRVK